MPNPNLAPAALDAPIAALGAIRAALAPLAGDTQAAIDALLAAQNGAQPIAMAESVAAMEGHLAGNALEWAEPARLTEQHVAAFLLAVWPNGAPVDVATDAQAMQAAIGRIVAAAEAAIGGP